MNNSKNYYTITNPCNIHLNVEGDFCPICLVEQVEKLKEENSELKKLIKKLEDNTPYYCKKGICSLG